MFTLESLLPVAEIVGALPLAAFAIVNSLVAEPVAVNLNNSLPLVSKIDVPIFGEVKVLFVKVSVDSSDTKVEFPPAGNNNSFVTPA